MRNQIYLQVHVRVVGGFLLRREGHSGTLLGRLGGRHWRQLLLLLLRLLLLLLLRLLLLLYLPQSLELLLDLGVAIQ